jgi:hypothetical protein
MKLTGAQSQQFQRALLSAFPKRTDLEQMVLFQLGESLEAIAGGDTTTVITFNLIQWVMARGRVEELIAGALAANPGNADLRAFVEQVGTVPPPSQPRATISAPSPIGAPFLAPPLPPSFVDRSEVIARLKADLLAGAPRTGVMRASAIHGMAGSGKSLLAAFLAHDKDIRSHFRDGVLWATLGQTPDLLALLNGWLQALGDFSSRFTSADAASGQLRTLLQEKVILLVVDDLWNAADALVFQVGGPNCYTIFTSRELFPARSIGAKQVEIGVMTPDQSLELLSHRLERTIRLDERAQALAVARTVGYLPLALDLAAAQVADSVSWTELQQDLEAQIAHLESLDLIGTEEMDEEVRKSFSVLASLQLSLRRLPADRRRGFVWLGVFPEDVELTIAMVATLWAIDERAARDTLRYLRDKALLMLGNRRSDGTQSYRLHDLLRDLARRLLVAPLAPVREGELPGMGMPLPNAHARLLEQYQARSRDKLWHTLPDDGYIYSRLTWHMEQAGQPDAIHALLCEETTTGKNGWYEALAQIGQTTNYVADVQRAWRLAEVAGLEAQPSASIGWQCRYALIVASLNSFANNIPPHMLAVMVAKEIVSPIQGLSFAHQMPDGHQQAEALASLMQYLPPDLLHPAFLTAQSIEDAGGRMEALALMAPSLPIALGYEALRQAFIAAQEINSGRRRAMALAWLAHHLPEPLQRRAALEQAIIATEAESGAARVWLLGALTHILPVEFHQDVIQQALLMARVDNQYDRAVALMVLVPYLPEQLAMQVLEELGRIVDEDLREYMLDLATSRLQSSRSADVGTNTSARYPLVYFSSKEMAESISAAVQRPLELLERESELDQEQLLKDLAPDLPEALLPQALRIAQLLPKRDAYGSPRARALEAVAPRLSVAQLDQVMEMLRSIEDQKWQAQAVAVFAPYLPEPNQTQALQLMLVRAQQIAQESERAQALASLVPRLPRSMLQQAIGMIQNIQRIYEQERVQVALAPRLVELGNPVDGLQLAQSIEYDEWREQALVALFPHLPESFMEQALKIVGELEYPQSRAQAISALAPHLPESLLHQTLRIANTIGEEQARANALVALLPRFPELSRAAVLRQELAILHAIEYPQWQAKAIAALAPALPKALREEVVQETLRVVQALDTHTLGYMLVRAAAIAHLLPYLSPLARAEVVQHELTEVWALPEGIAAEFLLIYAPHIQEPMIQQMLEKVLAIKTEWQQAEILARLAPNLSERWLAQSLELAIRISVPETTYGRTRALAALAPHLASLLPAKLYPLWTEILHELSIHSRQDLLGDLGALEPVIISLGGTHAVAELVRAVQDVGQWWP